MFLGRSFPLPDAQSMKQDSKTQASGRDPNDYVVSCRFACLSPAIVAYEMVAVVGTCYCTCFQLSTPLDLCTLCWSKVASRESREIKKSHSYTHSCLCDKLKLPPDAKQIKVAMSRRLRRSSAAQSDINCHLNFALAIWIFRWPLRKTTTTRATGNDDRQDQFARISQYCS